MVERGQLLFKLFFFVAGVSHLRVRPKGFPLALWKPSGASSCMYMIEKGQPFFLQFFSAAGISHLRVRPKGFPVALWKPSGAFSCMYMIQEGQQPFPHFFFVAGISHLRGHPLKRWARVRRASHTISKFIPCNHTKNAPLLPVDSALRLHQTWRRNANLTSAWRVLI